MEPLMQEFAEALRAQREAQGLTLDEIFRRTRINPELLEAIETGRFDILPPTYVRLFLKTYAREIGLDVEEVIRHYETIAPKPAPAAPQPKHPVSLAPLLALGLIFVAAIGLVAWQIRQYIPEDPALPLDMAAPPAAFELPDAPEKTSESAGETGQTEEMPADAPAPVAQPESQPLPVQGPMPEPQPVPALPATQPQRPVPETAPPQEPERAAPAQAPAPQLAEALQPNLQARPAAPVLAEGAQTPVRTPHPEPAESRALVSYDMPLPADLADLETLTLVGFVRENTRVSVYADGQTVFDGELRAGSRPSWQARENFRLDIVRAGAIALSLQNQAIAPPSPPDQSLRLLVNRTRIRVEELALPAADR